mmetsp:Transcript_31853/g.64702  ORF Transcript_31853/g.64702 Transcript_31853/m.64702 type:complete len:84 (+) Transcript_31853:123-374(+)
MLYFSVANDNNPCFRIKNYLFTSLNQTISATPTVRFLPRPTISMESTLSIVVLLRLSAVDVVLLHGRQYPNISSRMVSGKQTL